MFQVARGKALFSRPKNKDWYRPAEANMDILVVGTERNLQELSQRLGAAHRYVHHPTRGTAASDVASADTIFDFTPAKNPDDLNVYHNGEGFLFLNTTTVTLGRLLRNNTPGKRKRVCGFNGLDGFISHACVEISALDEETKAEVSGLLKKEKIDWAFVDDRVGMVTPRIICMIINEAFNTVHEGTASKSDIDLAMKLGTNYPYGPFEWCARIGVASVYELLEALYLDTHDERFRISPLLEKEYLAAQAHVI